MVYPTSLVCESHFEDFVNKRNAAVIRTGRKLVDKPR